MGKRFWIIWSACGAAIAGVFFLYWATHRLTAPTGAASGSRAGILSAVLGVPMVLSALRLRKLTDPRGAAWYAIPGLLGSGVLAAALLVGFMPDQPIDCSYLNRIGEIDPTCTTTSSERFAAIGEAAGFWLAFGITAGVAGRFRRRSGAAASAG